jgi:ribonuclease HI
MPHTLRTDGAARGNPGPAGIGVVLEDESGDPIEKLAKGIGWATNNVAEYQALIEGLGIARRHEVEDLVVVSDSRLLVEQMSGNFKVKSKGLKPLHAEARELASVFRSIRFKTVPRSGNAAADLLANQGIDEWLRDNPDATPPEPAQRELF